MCFCRPVQQQILSNGSAMLRHPAMLELKKAQLTTLLGSTSFRATEVGCLSGLFRCVLCAVFDCEVCFVCVARYVASLDRADCARRAASHQCSLAALVCLFAGQLEIMRFVSHLGDKLIAEEVSDTLLSESARLRAIHSR